MFRNCILKVASAFLSAALFAGVFGIGAPVYADETETNVTSTTEDEEIDPSHLKFVARLYSIVTRQDRCDPEEKANLAENLKDGIDAAYSIMYRFYFSDTYRALDISDEQFIEDLYAGCYGRYADDNDKNNVRLFAQNYAAHLDKIVKFMLPDLKDVYGKVTAKDVKAKLGKPRIDLGRYLVTYLEQTFDSEHIFEFEFMDDEFDELENFVIDG